MEYTVIYGLRSDIIIEVNNLIQQGWKPLGGVTADGYGRYAQAMIREKS